MRHKISLIYQLKKLLEDNLCFFLFVNRISLLQDAPLIFADQFLQLSISMDAPRFYGIGERLGPLMLDPSKGWEVIPLWATDRFVGVKLVSYLHKLNDS